MLVHSLKATIAQTLVQKNDQLVWSAVDTLQPFFQLGGLNPKPPDQEMNCLIERSKTFPKSGKGNQNLFLLDFFNFGDIFAHQHASPTVQITNQQFFPSHLVMSWMTMSVLSPSTHVHIFVGKWHKLVCIVDWTNKKFQGQNGQCTILVLKNCWKWHKFVVFAKQQKFWRPKLSIYYCIPSCLVMSWLRHFFAPLPMCLNFFWKWQKVVVLAKQ